MLVIFALRFFPAQLARKRKKNTVILGKQNSDYEVTSSLTSSTSNHAPSPFFQANNTAVDCVIRVSDIV
jgi:hypothetical protein